MYQNVPANRAAAISWAMELIEQRQVVFVDTETTGFGTAAEIVELAILDSQGDVLLDTLVKPARAIPISATLVHGIDDRRVAFAPGWVELEPLVSSLIQGRIVVAYNVHFDRAMIQQSYTSRSLDVPEVDWRCAMRAYAAFRGERSPHGRGFRWHGLADAAEAFGIAAGSHRALADAEACRLLVWHMAVAGERD